MSANPEYAALARKKAVLTAVVDHMLATHTSVYGGVPKTITADELPRDEAELSEEHVQEVIIDLQQNIEAIRLEMQQFDFVRKERHEPKGSPGAARAAKDRGAQGGRSRQGTRR